MALSKTFSVMKTDVGEFVELSDTAYTSIIGKMINNKYRDAWRRMSWSATINDDYTFATVASTATYDLPGDFDSEVFVANITDGKVIDRQPEGLWWRERYSAYNAGAITAAAYPDKYKILREMLNTTKTGYGKIQLDATPSAVKTIAMPYRRKFTELLGTTGTCTTDTQYKVINSSETFITDGAEPGMLVKNTTDSIYGIITSVDSETQVTCDVDVCPDGNEAYVVNNEIIIRDLDWIVMYGAIGEAYAYLRQFQKADYYLNRYEIELAKRIAQEKVALNQLYQRISDGYRLDEIRRLTGDSSYDSL